MCDHKKITCVHRNCESGLATIYTHAAHRQVQHTLQVIEMAWKDDSTLAISIALLWEVQWLWHRHRESGNKDKQHRQIATRLCLSL